MNWDVPKIGEISDPISYVTSNLGRDILEVWAELLAGSGDYHIRGKNDQTVHVIFRGCAFRILINERFKVTGVIPTIAAVVLK